MSFTTSHSARTQPVSQATPHARAPATIQRLISSGALKIEGGADILARTQTLKRSASLSRAAINGGNNNNFNSAATTPASNYSHTMLADTFTPTSNAALAAAMRSGGRILLQQSPISVTSSPSPSIVMSPPVASPGSLHVQHASPLHSPEMAHIEATHAEYSLQPYDVNPNVPMQASPHAQTNSAYSMAHATANQNRDPSEQAWSDAQRLARELDETAIYLFLELERCSANLPKELLIRVEKWAIKLSSVSTATLSLQKDRETYLRLLLDQVQKGALHFPFDKLPADGCLPRLPTYLNLNKPTMNSLISTNNRRKGWHEILRNLSAQFVLTHQQRLDGVPPPTTPAATGKQTQSAAIAAQFPLTSADDTNSIGGIKEAQKIAWLKYYHTDHRSPQRNVVRYQPPSAGAAEPQAQRAGSRKAQHLAITAPDDSYLSASSSPVGFVDVNKLSSHPFSSPRSLRNVDLLQSPTLAPPIATTPGGTVINNNNHHAALLASASKIDKNSAPHRKFKLDVPKEFNNWSEQDDATSLNQIMPPLSTIDPSAPFSSLSTALATGAIHPTSILPEDPSLRFAHSYTGSIHSHRPDIHPPPAASKGQVSATAMPTPQTTNVPLNKQGLVTDVVLANLEKEEAAQKEESTFHLHHAYAALSNNTQTNASGDVFHPYMQENENLRKALAEARKERDVYKYSYTELSFEYKSVLIQRDALLKEKETLQTSLEMAEEANKVQWDTIQQSLETKEQQALEHVVTQELRHELETLKRAENLWQGEKESLNQQLSQLHELLAKRTKAEYDSSFLSKQNEQLLSEKQQQQSAYEASLALEKEKGDCLLKEKELELQQEWVTQKQAIEQEFQQKMQEQMEREKQLLGQIVDLQHESREQQERIEAQHAQVEQREVQLQQEREQLEQQQREQLQRQQQLEAREFAFPSATPSASSEILSLSTPAAALDFDSRSFSDADAQARAFEAAQLAAEREKQLREERLKTQARAQASEQAHRSRLEASRSRSPRPSSSNAPEHFERGPTGNRKSASEQAWEIQQKLATYDEEPIPESNPPPVPVKQPQQPSPPQLQTPLASAASESPSSTLTPSVTSTPIVSRSPATAKRSASQIRPPKKYDLSVYTHEDDHLHSQIRSPTATRSSSVSAKSRSIVGAQGHSAATSPRGSTAGAAGSNTSRRSSGGIGNASPSGYFAHGRHTNPVGENHIHVLVQSPGSRSNSHKKRSARSPTKRGAQEQLSSPLPQDETAFLHYVAHFQQESKSMTQHAKRTMNAAEAVQHTSNAAQQHFQLRHQPQESPLLGTTHVELQTEY